MYLEPEWPLFCLEFWPCFGAGEVSVMTWYNRPLDRPVLDGPRIPSQSVIGFFGKSHPGFYTAAIQMDPSGKTNSIGETSQRGGFQHELCSTWFRCFWRMTFMDTIPCCTWVRWICCFLGKNPLKGGWGWWMSSWPWLLSFFGVRCGDEKPICFQISMFLMSPTYIGTLKQPT